MRAPARLVAPLRSSFRARLLAALLASVIVVLFSALFVVRAETRRQIAYATEQITERSREAFRQLEQLRHGELSRLAEQFTGSPRTFAVLEAVLESPAGSDDRAWLSEAVQYELELQRMTASLAAFADSTGEPVLTLLHGDEIGSADAAPVHGIARAALEPGAYVVVRDELFSAYVEPLALGGAPIGSVVLGLPVDDEVAERLGDALGVELCFVVDGRCLAGTAAAHAELAVVMLATRPDASPRLVTVDGRRWEVLAEPLAAGRPDAGARVIALSVDGVLAPFDRIQRALLSAGALALGFAVLLGALLARGFAGPVRELVGATSRVAAGDYTTRVPIRSADELGRLAAAFNDMTEGLELKERYRGVLDKVVSRDVADELLRSGLLLGGETRDVTTLFADIVGFTPRTEGMEPQHVIALLNDCMARLGEALERNGAVVDKFLGDGVMAVFGAPVAHPDDAARAVRAALDMHGEMRALAAELEARGEPAIRIAIGIAAGPVVAGNMGSPNRLNYTVVGESVNLAARLCAAAHAGETLVPESVQRRVSADVATFRALGARDVKGFSRAVEVFAVDAPHARAVSARRSGDGALRSAPLVTALLLAASAASATAQRTGGLPTLSDVGLGYRSPSGVFEIGLSGRLDLEAFVPQDEPAGLVATTDPFAAGRFRLFADLFAGDRVYGLVELRADRGQAPAAGSVEARIQQAFVRVSAPGSARLRAQAGKFAMPIGGYSERHQSPEDAFIRPPLLYDHRTIVAPRVAPAAAAGFLDWKDEPGRRERGTPIFWAVPYPWGAMLAAGEGPFDVRIAAMSAAPAGGPATWDFDTARFERPTFVAAAAVRISPELRASVYAARGPFLDEIETGTLPPGTSTHDFAQRLLGIDVVFMRAHVVLRAEAYANDWDVPNVEPDVRDVSYSAEGKLKIATGVFAAARYGGIRFNRFAPSPGQPREAWDHDVHRLQLAAGYRIVRNAEIRAEYALNRSTGTDRRDDLLALQLWWEF